MHTLTVDKMPNASLNVEMQNMWHIEIHVTGASSG